MVVFRVFLSSTRTPTTEFSHMLAMFSLHIWRSGRTHRPHKPTRRKASTSRVRILLYAYLVGHWPSAVCACLLFFCCNIGYTIINLCDFENFRRRFEHSKGGSATPRIQVKPCKGGNPAALKNLRKIKSDGRQVLEILNCRLF